MSEKRYYDPVRKWLENQGYFCGGNITVRSKGNYYRDIGTKQRRIDVAGVKNVGNRFEDDIEIAAIEVRARSVVSDADISDTAKYHNCVHKCYLAATAEITSEIRKYAERAKRRTTAAPQRSTSLSFAPSFSKTTRKLSRNDTIFGEF